MRKLRITCSLFVSCFAVLALPSIGLTAEGLTASQARSGWKMLFDGADLEGWRGYRRADVGPGWTVHDGVLTCSGRGAGDLITTDTFAAFELMLEYRLTDGANSGVMFHVAETDGPSWHTGPEIQLFDSRGKPTAERSGWLYELYQPKAPSWADPKGPLDAERPVGEWNQLYLRVSPQQCEICLNGMLYNRFTIGSDDWNQRVAGSKFAKLAEFGTATEGHIALQEHGAEVSFRNIKLRELGANGEVPQPIDGKLALHGVPAFPNLKWQDWEPVDDSGRVRELRLMDLTTARDGTNRLFAVAQLGKIFAFENRPDVSESELFLDLSDEVAQWNERGRNEQGLLGLAFHPDYAENGYFYVYYTAADDDRSVVARYQVSAEDPNRADPESQTVLLEIPQPYLNHNGGSIEFGPDGYLYIGLGDGGDRNDPRAAGQDPSQLLGSILRIDVDTSQHGKPYGIPADNPFAGAEDQAAGRHGEIYAFGVRNIWRLAFDRETGTLWAGDVGQELIEEVNLIQRGGNYGWSLREGFASFGNRTADPPAPPIEPVWDYDHQIGKSITGGRVYRSERLPELVGRYLYADYVSGKVWALKYDEAAEQVVRNDEIIAGGIPVLAFGEDENGEVYYMTADVRGQGIHRFERNE